MGRYHSRVQASARVVILVANPITYDGRVRRHASTLAAAGYDVCVLGVVGPNDRDEPPLPSEAQAAYPEARAAVRFRWLRIDRRRHGLEPRLRWLISASRQRLSLALYGLAQRLPGSATEPGAQIGLAQLAGLAVATSAPDLAWAAMRQRPDLIYANDLDTLPAAAWAARLCGVPFVYDAHEVYVDEHPALSPQSRLARACSEAYFSRKAAAILTVNSLLAEDLRQRYGLPTPTVVRNLPELAEADPITPPIERPLGETGTLHVLYHGAHIGLSQHGVDDLLRAMARLVSPGDALRLRLTLRGGLSPSEDRGLRQRIAELGISAHVRLMPPVPGAEALVRSAVLDGADVGLAVHPPLCLSYVYTTSSKVYEYQLAGLAVVASDVTGNRHCIAPQAGLFYPAGDDARLADCLRILSTNRDRLRAMQQAAYLHGMNSLRWRDERRLLIDTVERAIRRARRAG